jgi:DNA segregation ATPase FtsK/SpoIIIE, S-DNA-T family
MKVERVIVLSWIQNFFQKFIKDNEEEFAANNIHRVKHERAVSHKINEVGKDLTTKITYQYPKGRLSFPVIPKVPPKPEEPPIRKSRIERKSERSKQEPMIVPPVKKENPKTKIEHSPKMAAHPFQPTEIPSPVFGFKRPINKSTNIVEHELSHFLDDDFEQQTDYITTIIETVVETKPPITDEITPIVEMEDVSRNVISPIALALKESAATLEVQAIADGSDAIESIPLKYEDEQQTNEVEEMAEEQSNTNAVEEMAEEQSNTNAVEEMAEEQPNINALEEMAEEQPNTNAVEEMADEQSNTNAVEEMAEEQPNTNVVEEMTVEQPETSRPKRSHLPFNVMMLKQDKLKWEESKKKRRLQKESLQDENVNLRVIEEEKREENVNLQVNEEQKQEEKVIPLIIPEEKMEEKVPADNTNFEKTADVIQESEEDNAEEQDDDPEVEASIYEYPLSSLLTPPVEEEKDTEWILYQEELLNQTLINFNVGAKVVNVTQGPAVTRFEVQPEPGVKVNKITNLSDDIKLSLAARDIRIEAPIPGKHTIGIEVPNQKSRPVLINEIIQSDVFRESTSPLTAVLGLDISGKPIVTDLKKMPHGLIAGATGSGKSVCINTILVSLLFKASPEDLKLLLIDPKMVELAPYNRIPHLVSPVITDVKAATAALKWAVDEMERRYELFVHAGVRDINRFNELAMEHKRYSEKLPFMVIVIDELADLMMMSPADVEEAICRIAQKARACGIHLIVATQRPSVDVITGLIKANIPTRIAFSVSSQVDSRTIIDISGAEKLLGRGDMLFLENGSSKPVRLQGTFVSDEEIDLVVAHVREQRSPDYLFEQDELLKKAQVTEDEDELFFEACEFIIEQGVASTSSLQRRFKMGYNRAARLMDTLETNGFITSANGSKPREVLITEADLESMQDTGTMS